MRFADPYLKAEIEIYNKTVKERQLEAHYQYLCNRAAAAITESELQKLANEFFRLGDYKDARQRHEECLEKFKSRSQQNRIAKQLKKQSKRLLIIVTAICIAATLIITASCRRASYRVELFSVRVTEKVNDSYDNSKIHCSFQFEIRNNSRHDVAYLQGTMNIKDASGNLLSNGQAWFRGAITAKDTSYFDLSWSMSRNNDAVAVWNSDFSELVITYKITEIHFENGKVKEYRGPELVVNG